MKKWADLPNASAAVNLVSCSKAGLTVRNRPLGSSTASASATSAKAKAASCSCSALAAPIRVVSTDMAVSAAHRDQRENTARLQTTDVTQAGPSVLCGSARYAYMAITAEKKGMPAEEEFTQLLPRNAGAD